MKKIIPFIVVLALIASCKSYKSNHTINNDAENSLSQSDTVYINSYETDYEMIVIEPGFNSWLYGTARPRGYYSQQYLETRNGILVQEWNIRNSQPGAFDPNLYELRIDYDTRTDYGYDVNYKLYNYFIYFQLTYKQRLSSFLPKI
tara:strand:+ start:125 stop:562 length:438 start_codon:yes stop_codon:yes gene_type:complete